MPDPLPFLVPRLLSASIQIARLCVWLVLLAALFTPLERLFALRPREILRPGILTDLGYYFLSSLVPSLLLSAPLAIVSWGAHHLIPSTVTGALAALPLWQRIGLSLLVGEVGFYWGHRWSHEHPLLWRFHAVHHSAEHMDFLVNTRSHPVDMIFTRLCGLVPLYILGLAAPTRGSSSLVPVLIVLAGTVWGFFIHANVRWRFGVLEHLVATPAFHHWHHTNDGADVINKNYAPLMPWIDQIFGTLYLPHRARPVRYGIDQKLAPTLLGQLAEPFRRAHPQPPSHPAGNPLDSQGNPHDSQGNPHGSKSNPHEQATSSATNTPEAVHQTTELSIPGASA